MTTKCRWCFQDLDHCPEGNRADTTRLPRWLLRTARRTHVFPMWMESAWVDFQRRKRPEGA